MNLTSRPARTASAALIGVLALALFYPTLRWLVGEWLGNDYYSHGPLVPLISALLAWRLLKIPGDAPLTPQSWGEPRAPKVGGREAISRTVTHAAPATTADEKAGRPRSRQPLRSRPTPTDPADAGRLSPACSRRGRDGGRGFQPPGGIPRTAGLILLMLSLAGYLYALQQRAYFAAALMMILMIAALVWYLLGTDALRRLAFPIAFLLLMVPLPFVEPFSVPLAQFTGVCAGWTVRLFGVPIEINGAQVTLPNPGASAGAGTSLVVGAQCSGLRSIVTLLTLVALVVFLVKGPWWGKLLLALSSIPIAIIGNILRVASLLVVANIWGGEAGFKYYHDYSSPVFFLSALGLLLLFSRLVQCREIRDDLFRPARGQ